MKLLAAAYLAVLSGLDVVTTHMGLIRGAHEGNPITAHLLDTWGEPVLYLAKLGVIALVIVLALRRSPWLLWSLDLFMVLVVINNIARI
jgi:hypothetical protein